MPRQIDVIPGEPIEAAWGNPIRDTTIQRTATEATRDVEWPIPVSGDLAYIEALDVIQYFNGTGWVALITGAYLPLSGGTMTGPIVATAGGRILSAAIGGVIQRFNSDGDGDARRYEWRRGAAFGELDFYGINTGGIDAWIYSVSAASNIFRIQAANFTRETPTALGQIRNTLQSTSDPTAGQGIDGDVWLTYS